MKAGPSNFAPYHFTTADFSNLHSPQSNSPTPLYGYLLSTTSAAPVSGGGTTTAHLTLYLAAKSNATAVLGYMNTTPVPEDQDTHGDATHASWPGADSTTAPARPSYAHHTTPSNTSRVNLPSQWKTLRRNTWSSTTGRSQDYSLDETLNTSTTSPIARLALTSQTTRTLLTSSTELQTPRTWQIGYSRWL